MLTPAYAPAPRTGRGPRAAVAVLVALVLLAAGLAVADLRAYLVAQAGAPTFVAGNSSAEAAIAAVLHRRAQAVLAHDQGAFLATADPSRPAFVARERTEYANLVALGLSSFTLDPDPAHGYPLPATAGGAAGLTGPPRAVAVTVRYAVAGLDDAPVAEPWVPVFGLRQGHWVLLDEVTGGTVPAGVGGLPWQTGPIAVKRTPHIVAVVSADDEQLAGHLLDLAEQGLSRALAVRPTGWPGRVLVTAVTDSTVFRAYFRDDPEHVRQVAAIAVSTFDAVPTWSSRAAYVTTRVLFNPDTFGDGDAELLHTFTHEFTHAAMGALTAANTPSWLIEGIAEYVAYLGDGAGDGTATRLLSRVDLPATLPADAGFYDSADNYTLSWLACRLIARTYGQARLLALYQRFHDGTDDQATALQAVLGVSQASFTTAWLAYLRQLQR